MIDTEIPTGCSGPKHTELSARSAKITSGYNLPAKHVIHAVGPIWHGGQHNEDALLASCYKTAFSIMQQHGLKTIAFPAISCGVYRFPVARAAQIAISNSLHFLQNNPDVERVLLVCFSDNLFAQYQKILGGMTT